MLDFLVLGHIPGTSYQITLTWVIVTSCGFLGSILLYSLITRKPTATQEPKVEVEEEAPTLQIRQALYSARIIAALLINIAGLTLSRALLQVRRGD